MDLKFKKKYIILGIIILIGSEVLRHFYYQSILNNKNIEVINYLEKNKKIDQELIEQLNKKGIKISYSFDTDNQVTYELCKKHVILFVIELDCKKQQTYVFSRLNK
ncbi:MAG: hypothetical protein SO253_00540 [Bacilli bacterium]|nr:hypothetical protein [Bacilli bacterium]